MAITYAYLTTPVAAKVTQQFGLFQEGQQVDINRVAPGRKALMLGVKDECVFLPRTHVDKEAQEAILRQYEAIKYGEEAPPSANRQVKKKFLPKEP